MKSSFKIIAAAVALLAAGSSFAQVVTPVPTSATGTDMLFIAYDKANGTSFTEDLGITYTAFANSTAATLGQVFAIGTSSAFQNYVSTTMTIANSLGESYANGLQGTVWAVIGGQTGSAKGFDSTITAGTALSNSTSGPLSVQVGQLAYLTGTTGLNNQSYTAAQLQAGIFSKAADYTNSGYAMGTTTFNPKYGNAVGASAEMVNYVYTGGVPSTVRTPSVFSANGSPIAVSFDGSNLSFATSAVVAAVPEPTSYAMMLAGLLMIGALAARRRDSK